MSVVILRGDAASLPLPDESVDLIVCSPPYWGLRSYSDAGEHYAGQIGSEETPGEYIAALLDCTREWIRVLKPAGSLFVNLGDSYASQPGANGQVNVRNPAQAHAARRGERNKRPTGGRQVTREDAAWLAGVIDSDGSVSVHVNKQPEGRAPSFVAWVRIGQMRPEVVRRTAEITGTGQVYQDDRGVWNWSASAQQARWVLARIYPWLLIKKRQAAAAIEVARHVEAHNGRGSYRPLTHDDIAYRQRLQDAVRAWNKGRDDELVPPEPVAVPLPVYPLAPRAKSLYGLPDEYAAGCVGYLGLIRRADIIWQKPNGLPESVQDRVRRSHEVVFHFTRRPRYYSAVDEIREAHTYPNDLHFRGKRNAHSPGAHDKGNNTMANPLGKLPGSVWTIPSAPLTVPAHLGVDHFACVDAETEVLARRGWLRHDQLRAGDEIAGFDLDLGVARWTACHGVNVYGYDGDLVAVDKPRALSMRLTPNHRTIVHKGVGVHRQLSGPFVIEAGGLGPKHFIPRSAEWADPDHGTKRIGADLAALCGWIAAEGWYGENKVCLSQSATANPVHVAEIDALLQRLSGSWDGPDGARNVGAARGRWRATVQVDGVIRRKNFETEEKARAAAAEWRQELGLDRTLRTERQRYYSRASRPWTDVQWRLSPRLGAEIRRLMPEKRLTWDLANLAADEAGALLRAFISGDGHTRKDGRIAIFQAVGNKVTMDVLQAIAVRLGYKTNLSLNGGRWVLYLTAGGRPLTLRGANGSHPPVAREHYRGIVWCPTTGTGTFIARRNGSVFITGNSFPMELPRRIVLGWSPAGICTACGEGRRPVTSSVRTFDGQPRDDLPAWADPTAPRRTPNGAGHWRFGTDRRMSGYACACPDTSAPTRPAVVLDPFSGTGTTQLAASVLGRIGVGVDRSMDYCRLAKWRTADPGEIARAMGVPKPPPVPEGQGSLFDALGGEAS